MPFVQRHPMLAALAVVAALLAGLIGLELAFGTPSPPQAGTSSKGAPTEAKLVPAVVATAPDAYPEMVARPLFVATRRPAPEAPAAQPSAMVKGQFILQGVTIVGEKRIALLREKSSGRTHRVERGKDINGITLASVDPDRIVLAQGADREEVALTVQKGPAPAPAPAGFQGAPSAPVQMPAPSAPAAGNQSAPPPPQAITGAGPFLPPGYNPAPAAPAQPTAAAPGTAPAAAASQPLAQPLTPEETLARRRARRVQQNP
jgi:hypothetical protein